MLGPCDPAMNQEEATKKFQQASTLLSGADTTDVCPVVCLGRYRGP